MMDERILRQAVEIAWSLYVAEHGELDAADQRRALLARHLQDRLRAGERDPEELACSGLAYLNRVPADPW